MRWFRQRDLRIYLGLLFTAACLAVIAAWEWGEGW